MKKRFLRLYAWLSLPLHLGGAPEILSVKKIWDEAPYSAFTDLIFYQDRFFCCFREGTEHEHDNGSIRILFSEDGKNWTSAALLTMEGHDLRDPMLSEMPDGKLMLNVGITVWRGEETVSCQSAVFFSVNGVQWDPIQILPYPGEWIWRVTWHEGIGYAGSYSSDGKGGYQLKLMETTNGVDYQVKTMFSLSGSPTEATFRILPDQTMIGLVRRNKEKGLIGRSVFPYTDWEWEDAGYTLGGPNFIVAEDGILWACSRRMKGGEESVVLAKMTPFSYHPVLTFPSSGDSGYPGMVWKEGKLYISYYTSLEEKTSIYLAIVTDTSR